MDKPEKLMLRSNEFYIQNSVNETGKTRIAPLLSDGVHKSRILHRLYRILGDRIASRGIMGYHGAGLNESASRVKLPVIKFPI